MGNIKQVNIKNRTYYFFNHRINIKDFDSRLLIIDKNSYKNSGIDHIGYITTKRISDYENINSVNVLYLIIGEADEYTEKKNGNKYLTFASTEKKKILETYTKRMQYHIQKINSGKFGEHEKDFTRIKFNSDDDLSLNKILKLHNVTVIVRSVFEENDKVFLD